MSLKSKTKLNKNQNSTSNTRLGTILLYIYILHNIFRTRLNPFVQIIQIHGWSATRP